MLELYSEANPSCFITTVKYLMLVSWNFILTKREPRAGWADVDIMVISLLLSKRLCCTADATVSRGPGICRLFYCCRGEN